MNKNIWVYVELHQNSPVLVTYELLAKARILSANTGDKVVAITLCDNSVDIDQSLIAYGADVVLKVNSPYFKTFKTIPYATALFELVQKYQPSIILFGATYQGRDLAPRLQAKLQTGLTADCLDLNIDDKGLLVQTKPSYGDNIMCNIVCPEKRPQMATVRPKVFSPFKDENRTGEVIVEKINVVDDENYQIVEYIPIPCGACQITSAEKIVAIGRLFDKEEHIKHVQTLANILNASIGVTRPLTDLPQFSHDEQIGQSGLTVKPKLIINLAISGAVQYTVGMSNSKVIISVNKNADAPIFGISHYGYVGDATKLLPALIEELKKNE